MSFTDLSINWTVGINWLANGITNMCSDVCGNIFASTIFKENEVPISFPIIYLEYISEGTYWNGSILWYTPNNQPINGICVDNYGYIYCTTGNANNYTDSAVFKINIKTQSTENYVSYLASYNSGNSVQSALIHPIGIAYYENYLYLAMNFKSFIGIINATTLNVDLQYQDFNFIGNVQGCTGLSIQTNFSNQNTIPGSGGDGQGSGGLGNLQTYYMAVLFISCVYEDNCVYGYWLTQGFNYNGSWASTLVYSSPGLGYQTWTYQNPNNVSVSTWSQGTGGNAITTAGGDYFYINNTNAPNPPFGGDYIYQIQTGYQGTQELTYQPYTSTNISGVTSTYPIIINALAYNPILKEVIFAGNNSNIYSLSG